MTLGEKIASARKEKGMTQEMPAEQLGVTRQAVARWETGKALPGTANLFMLRQLLGIPLEAADMEATDLERDNGNGKIGNIRKHRKSRKPDSKAEVDAACGSGNSAVVCSAICWAWRGSGASAALADSNYCSLFDSNREKRYCGGCKINRQKNVVSDSSNAAGTRSMERCFCGISKLPKQGYLEYAAGGMAELPRGCRMDAALRNNGKWRLYAAGGPAFRQGNTTAYLVCRNGVTNEQAGKITPNPLRLRFWVTYQAGESEPMLDVLTFCGNKDYQVFFRIGKDQSDCIFTTNESEALARRSKKPAGKPGK